MKLILRRSLAVVLFVLAAGFFLLNLMKGLIRETEVAQLGDFPMMVLTFVPMLLCGMGGVWLWTGERPWY